METTEFDLTKIIRRAVDGSYVISRDGLAYHVPNEGEYAGLWNAVNAYAVSHPDAVEEEAPPPEPTKEELKEMALQAKMSALSAAFESASRTAHCHSFVGFEINADETANRNVEGLVLVMEPGQSTLFRSYDDTFHSVTREQLEQMRKEIAINSQALYQAKWTLESQITGAADEDTLAGITVTAEAITALAEQLKQQGNQT